MESILQFERREEDDYYAILGCDELSSNDQIISEYKARVFSCHPDKHPDNPAAAEKFSFLQRAKETLTDPVQKKLYDTWRRSGICIPYSEWKARKDTLHTAMHWASTKKKEPMIDDCTASDRIKEEEQKIEASEWQDSFKQNVYLQNNEPVNDILKKFRNYQV